METAVRCCSLSLPTTDKSNMQPPLLHHVARSRFDVYNILSSLLSLLHNTPKESCKIKYNKYFTPSSFSTPTNVHINDDEKMLHILRSKTSRWIAHMGCLLCGIGQAWPTELWEYYQYA